MGWGEGHRERQWVRVCACAPGAAPVRKASPPCPLCSHRALRRVPPTFHPFFGFTQTLRAPRAATGRREPCPSGGTREDGRSGHRKGRKASQEGKEGDPRSPVNLASPFPPLSSPIRRADPPPPRRGPPAAGGRAAVAGQTAGGGRRGQRGREEEEEEEEGSRGQARAAALAAPGTTPGQPELFLSVTRSALGCS